MGVLDRESLGMGAEVKQFEEMLTEFFGRPTLCVSTGTAALHLALQAVGIGVGDEVIVQSLTYVASFQAVSATGATPVACDVDPNTLCLDWRDAEKRLTPKTKALMPVHYSGGVGELDDIYNFADKNGLRVIEDAAHAFGTTYNGKKVGSFGDIACFSFDGIKNITSGEGGCIVADDELILNKIKNTRLLGVERDTEMRFSSKRSWEFDVTEQGWRYHMSNIMAAIGIEQLKRFSGVAKKRQRLAKLYDYLLKDQKQIKPFMRNYDEVIPHIYVIRIIGLDDRQKLCLAMENLCIEIGYHYQPNHYLRFYKDDKNNGLLNTDKIFPELVTLPLHADLKETDVVNIVKHLETSIRHIHGIIK